MDLFSEELQIITEKDFNIWKRYSYRFRCYFCGHKFKIGEKFRAIFTNDTDAPGNPLTCETCNNSTPLMRTWWRCLSIEAKELKEGRLWWFFRQANIEGEYDYMNREGKPFL